MKWVRVELTVAMDWYTRCVLGIRLTPYSSKAVDAAAVLYQVMRPPPSSDSWPEYAVWPCHGVPREVVIEADQIDRTGTPTATPALNPEAIVVDHGKIYLSDHLNSVCQRLGISIQPARIRKGSDKGPLERFFRTVREGLLQYLPGYKGPDLGARGLDVEGHAFFYVDQLEAIIREWVATVYHHRKHDSLFDPGMPTVNITPAQMFSHGIARAGYLEVSRDPQLAYEFLAVEARTIQHYGVQRGKLRYGGDVLTELSQMKSPYRGKFTDKWPIHVDPDDVSRVYIRHPRTRQWHELLWEHASAYPMPFADDALQYFRRIVRDEHGFVDDHLALDEMFTRWKLGIGRNPTERRMALRAARADSALSKQVGDRDAVRDLPSVTAALSGHDQVLPPDHVYGSDAGDDDSPDELDDDYDSTGRYAVDVMEWT